MLPTWKNQSAILKSFMIEISFLLIIQCYIWIDLVITTILYLAFHNWICYVWWFLYNYTLLHLVVRKAHLSPHVCVMSLLCPSIWITWLFLPVCLVLTSLWFLVSWYTLLCFSGQNDEVSERSAGLEVQGWGQISRTGPFRVASCGNCSWSAYSFVPWMQ